MSQVKACLVGAGDARPDQRWGDSAGDLARAACEALLAGPAGGHIDLVCVAGQPAATIVDRLGLAGRVAVQEAGGGDAAGALALHAAVAHVAAGLCRAALVVGVAKVSDLTERDRVTLLDATLDPEAEQALGLTYQALAGLLADAYLARHGLKVAAFGQVTAKNAGAAVKGGETFWSHAPSVLELARDLPAAPPLGRSDFAPILDGASAVLIMAPGLARELGLPAVEILGAGAGSDLGVVAERGEPLTLAAAGQAGRLALGQAGLTLEQLAFVELSSAASILETLAAENLGLAAPGGYGTRCKEGASPPVNPSGGAQGRGFTFGACGVAQAREAFLQLGPGAGARQVAAASVPGASALTIGLGGLGTIAVATVFRRPA